MTMPLPDINALLDKGLVRISFTKKSDGSTRTMRCTRHPSIMPPPPAPKLDSAGNAMPTRPMPYGHILVWDVEASGLRSFDSATLNADPELIEEL